MTRTERKALKRKYKTNMWVSGGCLIFFFTMLILTFTITWRPTIINELIDKDAKATTLELLVAIGIISIYIVPIIMGVFFNMKSIGNVQDFKNEKNRLYKKQLRMYVEWFTNAIVQGDYERAIDLHNEFIWGDTKVLTRGILIGFLFKSEDKDQVINALKHLSKIPDEVYDPTKYTQ